MQIFIQHNGQQTGPFTVEQVRAGLANGTYQPSDMAWHEGAAGWLPLSTIPGIGENSPPPLPGSSGARTSSLAIWSLALGVLALPTMGLAAIPAVICGHIALGNIKRSAGTQTGGGLAIAGLITGYLGFAILVVAMLAGLTAPHRHPAAEKGESSGSHQQRPRDSASRSTNSKPNTEISG